MKDTSDELFVVRDVPCGDVADDVVADLTATTAAAVEQWRCQRTLRCRDPATRSSHLSPC